MEATAAQEEKSHTTGPRSWSWAPTGGLELGDDRLKCGCFRPLDFGRPTQREAVCLTRASLLVALVFWIIILVATCQGDASATIIEVGLESLLDLISTGVVLYRLQVPGALIKTHRNEVVEARTSVVLGLSLVTLGIIFSAFALSELVQQSYDGLHNAVLEIVIALPASLIYLAIGGLQLNMSWILRLRSLKQDAIISILGAISSFFSAICALVNIIVFVANVDQTAFMDASYNFTDNPGFIANVLYSSRNYKYWWLDELFSLIVAAVLLILGIQQLKEDVDSGLEFWTKPFWFDPLPPEEHAGAAPLMAEEEKGEAPQQPQQPPTESTPLTSKK